MKIDLSNKVAFITGASSGIGKATAILLAGLGANVGLFAPDKMELMNLEKEINLSGKGQALALPGDVSDENNVKDAIEQLVKKFGSLNLAVNNAGILGVPGLIHEMDTDNWKNVLGVNLDGVFYSAKYEIPRMLDSGGGSIVNVASVEAHNVSNQYPAYMVSKHALLGLTKTLARDYAKQNIRVNSVSPGVIKTPIVEAVSASDETWSKLIPLGRLGTAEEVARTIAFLLSDLSSYTTSSDFLVDGGWLLPNKD